LSKSENLSSLLTDTLQATDDELRELEACKAKLEKNLARRSRALDLNLKRVQLRAQRPGREMVSDDVQSRLLGQGKLLQASIDKIGRCMKNADIDHSKLWEAKEALASDRMDKDEAMRLDTQALSLKSADFTQDQGGLQKKVFAYPHNWYKGTGQGVHEARNLQNDASRLRLAIERLLEESAEAEKMMERSLNEALRERTEVTNAVKGHLQQQREATRVELLEAQKRKAALLAAMDSKREPMALARQRYQMRKQRPTRELVHDEVEDALTQEFHDLQVIVNNMEQKIKGVEREIQVLNANMQQLDANIVDKASALSLDTQCMDLRVAGSVAGSVVSSRASNGSMQVLQQKIDSMEHQLTDARKSRQQMETKLTSLKGSLGGREDLDC